VRHQHIARRTERHVAYLEHLVFRGAVQQPPADLQVLLRAAVQVLEADLERARHLRRRAARGRPGRRRPFARHAAHAAWHATHAAGHATHAAGHAAHAAAAEAGHRVVVIVVEHARTAPVCVGTAAATARARHAAE
jgi:hypothetical protein